MPKMRRREQVRMLAAEKLSKSGADMVQGVAVANTPPTNGQVLAYNSTTGRYEPSSAGGSFSGAYADLTGKPTLGTAASTAASDYATAAQGAKADTALQPNGSAAGLTSFPTLNQNTTGSAARLTTPRTINGTAFDGTANIVLANGSVTDAMNAGTTAATSATTGTMTVSMTTDVITITPTGACTFNASGGRTGRVITFIITTSGSSSWTLTWGTNFRKTGTLATGVTTARFFAVTFLCIDGTIWQEIARTAVQT